MKKCTKCKVIKELDQYHEGKAECKTCFRKRGREYYLKNREQRLRYTKEYDLAHNEERKLYRIKNRKKIAQRTSEYLANNPDKVRRNNALRCDRKARKKYLVCDCCDRENIISFYINRKDDAQVDHVLCSKLGGKHCLKNLQYLSEEDHIKKSAKERAIFKLIRELKKGIY